MADGYVGSLIAELKQKFCAGSQELLVDFELAFKGLENRGLVQSGPMRAHDNPPGSSVVVIGFYSKREYAYLTENGYRAAREAAAEKSPNSIAKVQISGNTFHQSPIGVDSQIVLSITNTGSDFAALSRALLDLGIPADEVSNLELAIEEDKVNDGKPSFEGKTGSWFTRLLARAGQGALGVDVVASGVGKALSNYLGS